MVTEKNTLEIRTELDKWKIREGGFFTLLERKMVCWFFWLLLIVFLVSSVWTGWNPQLYWDSRQGLLPFYTDEGKVSRQTAHYVSATWKASNKRSLGENQRFVCDTIFSLYFLRSCEGGSWYGSLHINSMVSLSVPTALYIFPRLCRRHQDNL